jgi:hypothetical protein
MSHNKAVDLAVPFNSWTRFSFKLLFKTLPLNYPGRTLLLYRLGQLGQQGTGQQGILPSYLQESIPLGGGPTRAWQAYTQRANPFATLGTTMPPVETTGNPDIGALLGNVSPLFGITHNTLSATDFQTGAPINDAQGNPINSSPEDIGRYLGAQAAALFPPLGIAAGGTRGKAATSIPLIAEQNKKATSTAPQASQPPWLALANSILPIRIDVRNQTADQAAGVKKLTTYLAKKQAAEINAEASKPGGTAKVKARWTKIGAEIRANYQHYVNDPKALDALLASGTTKR